MFPRSLPRNEMRLDGTGFDEEKCRNVLVRYCAFIPRNYQYRDGIRLVFLVLRDHLGDEWLGLAGGVLYELIEVDCQHSDDPGAAFQRWRHDHLRRHADLELPHVPHLTTVTSTIAPTDTLIQWRKDHPERYQTRLSDYAPRRGRSVTPTTGIRTKKDWMIDYTMYVSSRDGGTRPYRRINAKEFHELHWSPPATPTGRLIGEKSVDLTEVTWNSESVQAGDETQETQATQATQDDFHPKSGPKPERQHHLRGFFRRVLTSQKRVSIPERASWSADQSGRRHTLPLRDVVVQSRSSLCVNEWDIPNAIFARKFGIYKDNRPIPPSIKESPVAEDLAMDAATVPALRDLIYSWRFQGPFTPQLWFDSGIDYRWQRG